jgi:hypothetical protein
VVHGDGDIGDSFADTCKEFKQGFLGVSSGFPHYQGYV